MNEQLLCKTYLLFFKLEYIKNTYQYLNGCPAAQEKAEISALML